MNAIYVNSPDSEGSAEDPSQVFVNSVVNGAITTAGVAVGGALVCYALDGIATIFFPPAASLAVFCPAVGAASGGTKFRSCTNCVIAIFVAIFVGWALLVVH